MNALLSRVFSVKKKGLSKVAPRTETKTGSWSGTGGDFSASVTWTKGNATTPNSGTVGSSFKGTGSTFVSSTQTTSTYFIGQVDFTFTFAGSVEYTNGTGHYSGSGSVDMNTGNGSVSWSLKP